MASEPALLRMASASVARPADRARAAGLRQRLHRDHAVRSHQVRGRQGVGLSARRPPAARLVAAAGALRLRSADLLRRERESGCVPARSAATAIRSTSASSASDRSTTRRSSCPRASSAGSSCSIAARPTTRSSRCSRTTSSTATRAGRRRPAADPRRAAAALLQHLQARVGAGAADRDPGDVRASTHAVKVIEASIADYAALRAASPTEPSLRRTQVAICGLRAAGQVGLQQPEELAADRRASSSTARSRARFDVARRDAFGVAGVEDHRDLGPDARELVRELDARRARHHLIGDHEVEAREPARDERHRFAPRSPRGSPRGPSSRAARACRG